MGLSLVQSRALLRLQAISLNHFAEAMQYRRALQQAPLLAA